MDVQRFISSHRAKLNQEKIRIMDDRYLTLAIKLSMYMYNNVYVYVLCSNSHELTNTCTTYKPFTSTIH